MEKGEVMEGQFGEAYVFCKCCHDFYHVSGRLFTIDGKLMFSPDREDCHHCGGQISALTINSVGAVTNRYARENGRRFSHHLRDAE